MIYIIQVTDNAQQINEALWERIEDEYSKHRDHCSLKCKSFLVFCLLIHLLFYCLCGLGGGQFLSCLPLNWTAKVDEEWRRASISCARQSCVAHQTWVLCAGHQGIGFESRAHFKELLKLCFLNKVTIQSTVSHLLFCDWCPAHFC